MLPERQVDGGGGVGVVKTEAQTNMASSLHSHTKITAEMQNNHHSEPLEIEWNGGLTIAELKRPRPSRLVGGV